MIKINRAGRKRKVNVIRDDTGKSRGEIFDPSAIFAQPHRRDTPDPSSVDAGSPLGRLRLNGLITPDQMRAGNEYASVVLSYARVMGIPSASPRGSSFADAIATGFYAWEGERTEIDQEEADRRVRRVRERYNDCHDALAELGRQHGRGRNILIVMREICVAETEERSLWHDAGKLGDLRLGLNAVQRVLVDRGR